MPIILRLDRVMADRKMSLNELSEKLTGSRDGWQEDYLKFKENQEN